MPGYKEREDDSEDGVTEQRQPIDGPRAMEGEGVSDLILRRVQIDHDSRIEFVRQRHQPRKRGVADQTRCMRREGGRYQGMILVFVAQAERLGQVFGGGLRPGTRRVGNRQTDQRGTAWAVDVATGKYTRLSPVLGGGCEPRFSPDGRRVVYVSRGHLSDQSRLVEYDLATEKERVLVAWPALNYDPVYSPDGSEVAFASNMSGDWAVYRQRIADGKAWRMTDGPGPARNPDYRPR
jgi:dipeptidyl aminopeptidase/acylaminoacyl peptidase